MPLKNTSDRSKLAVKNQLKYKNVIRKQFEGQDIFDFQGVVQICGNYAESYYSDSNNSYYDQSAQDRIKNDLKTMLDSIQNNYKDRRVSNSEFMNELNALPVRHNDTAGAISRESGDVLTNRIMEGIKSLLISTVKNGHASEKRIKDMLVADIGDQITTPAFPESGMDNAVREERVDSKQSEKMQFHAQAAIDTVKNKAKGKGV
jgi:membrane-associated HD superfamily phosphohydrolase